MRISPSILIYIISIIIINFLLLSISQFSWTSWIWSRTTADPWTVMNIDILTELYLRSPKICAYSAKSFNTQTYVIHRSLLCHHHTFSSKRNTFFSLLTITSMRSLREPLGRPHLGGRPTIKVECRVDWRLHWRSK